MATIQARRKEAPLWGKAKVEIMSQDARVTISAMKRMGWASGGDG
jgi:uncharacterized protein (DUF2345 family)